MHDLHPTATVEESRIAELLDGSVGVVKDGRAAFRPACMSLQISHVH